MKIGKWGKDLAFRIPIALVRKLGLKEGDAFDPLLVERVLMASQTPSSNIDDHA